MNRRLPFSRDSEAGKLPRQQEQEILAAASKVFRTAFPNSERAGCPPQITLLSVVRKRCEAGESERILEHMTCCSACFGEYEDLLAKRKGLEKPAASDALCRAGDYNWCCDLVQRFSKCAGSPAI